MAGFDLGAQGAASLSPAAARGGAPGNGRLFSRFRTLRDLFQCCVRVGYYHPQ
jgi:hypothetical protein